MLAVVVFASFAACSDAAATLNVVYAEEGTCGKTWKAQFPMPASGADFSGAKCIESIQHKDIEYGTDPSKVKTASPGDARFICDGKDYLFSWCQDAKFIAGQPDKTKGDAGACAANSATNPCNTQPYPCECKYWLKITEADVSNFTKGGCVPVAFGGAFVPTAKNQMLMAGTLNAQFSSVQGLTFPDCSKAKAALGTTAGTSAAAGTTAGTTTSASATSTSEPCRIGSYALYFFAIASVMVGSHA